MSAKEDQKENLDGHIFSVCLAKIKKPTYFTIQFIFTIIHGSHYTISANFYLYLPYFQQNK